MSTRLGEQVVALQKLARQGIARIADADGHRVDQPIEKIYIGSAIPELDRRAVYHTHALGSAVAMTGSDGSVIKEYRYEAFGKLRYEAGPGPLAGNRYTYTAREALGDSLGLLYYRWRVLDPNVGRFTGEDALGFVDGPNTYSYVRNNSVLRADPSGMNDVTVDNSCKDYLNFIAVVPETGTAAIYPPTAGATYDADGIYIDEDPDFGWKLTDNCWGTLYCKCEGGEFFYEFSYTCWPWWLGGVTKFNKPGPFGVPWPF